jgi:hypothetical protein
MHMIAVMGIEGRAHIAERNAPNGDNYRCLQARGLVMDRHNRGQWGEYTTPSGVVIHGAQHIRIACRYPPNRGSTVRVAGLLYRAIRGKFSLRQSRGFAGIDRRSPRFKGLTSGMRLSILRSAGIFASVLWAIGGSNLGIRLAENDAVSLSTAYMACFLPSGEQILSEPCARMGEELARYPYWTNRIIGVVAFGLLPILFVWLAGFTVIRIGRWVMKGEPATP